MLLLCGGSRHGGTRGEGMAWAHLQYFLLWCYCGIIIVITVYYCGATVVLLLLLPVSFLLRYYDQFITIIVSSSSTYLGPQRAPSAVLPHSR